jgi:hypothetical protein
MRDNDKMGENPDAKATCCVIEIKTVTRVGWQHNICLIFWGISSIDLSVLVTLPHASLI